jgi:O-antigen/teichoic acid export membrane protein
MLVRHAATYLAGNVATALFGFLGVTLYTRLLSPEQYGTYVLGHAAAGILSAFLFVWVKFSLVRYQSEGEHVDVRTTAFVAYVGSASVMALGAGAAVLTTDLPPIMVASSCFFCLTLAGFELSQEVMRARLEAGRVMRSSILRSGLGFGLGLLMVLLGGGGLGLLLGVALAYVLATSVYARKAWGERRAGFDRKTLTVFMTLGLPIALSSFVFALASGLDRLAIGYILGKSASGEYGASADLVRQIITFPAMSMAGAVLPLAVRALASEGAEAARHHVARSGELLLAVTGPMAAGLAIVSPALAALLIGPDFHEAAETVMPIASMAALVAAINQAYVHTSFHLSKSPHLMLRQAILILTTNLVVIYPLVATFGIAGGALAVVVSEITGMAGGFLLARRSFPLPLELGRLARVLIAIAAMAAATLTVRWFLDRKDILALAAMIITGAITYTAAACLLDVAQSRSFVAQLWQRWRMRAAGVRRKPSPAAPTAS